MAVIRQVTSDGSSGLDWMVMATFLGAIYCLVLGVFKRFSASMNFSGLSGGRNKVEEQPPRAVYRTFTEPSFTTIQEGSNGSTPAPYPKEPPRVRPVVKLPPSAYDNGQLGAGSSPAGSAPTPAAISRPTPSPAPAPTTGTSAPRAPVPIPSAGTSGVQGKTDSSSTAKTTKDDKALKAKAKEKEKRDKLKKEKKEKEKKEKVKKEKEEIKKKEKEEKTKKENDKANKSKNNKEKTLKSKAPTQPVASVTIDQTAVASAGASATKIVPPPQPPIRNPIAANSGNLNPVAQQSAVSPPPYQEQDVFAKVRNKEANNPIQQAEPQGFSSSWDQVAQHRQNMHRELQASNTPTKNLRAMANPNQEGKDVNILGSTPTTSNTMRRYSPPSEGSTDPESDTEA